MGGLQETGVPAKEVTESEAPGQSVPSGFKERGGEQGDWRSAGIRELAPRVVRNGKGQGRAGLCRALRLCSMLSGIRSGEDFKQGNDVT